MEKKEDCLFINRTVTKACLHRANSELRKGRPRQINPTPHIRIEWGDLDKPTEIFKNTPMNVKHKAFKQCTFLVLIYKTDL